MYTCVHMHLQIPLEDREGWQISLEPALQGVVSLIMWVLQTELGSSVREDGALSC